MFITHIEKYKIEKYIRWFNDYTIIYENDLTKYIY